MPPSVTDLNNRPHSVHHSAHHNNTNNRMTSGSFFKVRDRDEVELQDCRKRACIKWLVAKAYNNNPPRDLAEPFYKDHNNVERLKPHLVHALATAELYCLSLAHLYHDPNMNNLNHLGIIQSLARKGVYVSQPADCSLTETVLIQTSPLRMSAHLAVTEALMALFVRELAPAHRISEAVRRFAKTDDLTSDALDEALIFWVSQSCQAVRIRLEDNKADNGGSDPSNNDTATGLPKFNKLQHLSDFTDGVGLTALIALYCPDELSWTEIAMSSDPPTLADSLCNIQLFQRFCHEALPYNPCHLTLEDIFYMHGSMKLNMESLLADMFHLLEVEPVRCVDLPGVPKDKIIEVPDPEMRLKSPSRSISQQDTGHGYGGGGDDDSFVVQRGRTIPTLASVASHSHRSVSPASELGQKERMNQDTKSEERGEADTPSPHTVTSLNRSNSLLEQAKNMQAAGRPSSRTETPQASRSYAGRRSRRNSSDDNHSQISLENIGGSMENISVLGRNPDKEMRVHSGRRADVAIPLQKRGSANQQTFDIRLLNGDEAGPDNDASMFIDNRELDAMEKRYGGGSANEPVSTYTAVANSNSSSGMGGSVPMAEAGEQTRERKTSFADLRRKSQTQNQFASSGIHINYSDGDEKEDLPKQKSVVSMSRRSDSSGSKPPSSVWDPQPNHNNYEGEQQQPNASDEMNERLNSVRLKLEERRRRIEEEKRKIESISSRQKREPSGEPSSAVKYTWLSDRSGAGRPQDSDPNMSDGMRVNNSQQQQPQQFPNRPPMGDTMNDMNANMSRYGSPGHVSSPYGNMVGPPGNGSNPTSPHHHPYHGGQFQMYQPQHPMDPQPVYMGEAPPSGHTPPRRTWGQPQPINFGMGHSQPPHPSGYDRYQPPGGMYGGGGYSYQAPPHFDQYGNPLPPSRGDNWPMHNNNMYGGGSQPPQHPGGYNDGYHPHSSSSYMSPPGSAMHYNRQSPYSPAYSGAPTPYGQQANAYSSPYQSGPPTSTNSPRTPFRLHQEVSGQGGVNLYKNGYDQDQMNVSGASPQVSKSGGFSRHASKEYLNTSGGQPQQQQPIVSSPSSPNATMPRRLHAPVPAPPVDDMAPQNISFIENSSDDEEKKSLSPVPRKSSGGSGSGGANQSDSSGGSTANLTERLSRLNISRGDKTYRVQLHADGREPTALSTPEPQLSPVRPSSRPTISSTFKERRKGSAEGGVSAGSGPASLVSNSGGGGPTSLPNSAVQTKLTEEEIETLNNMKTEVLKETGDPSKGFVISFEDDKPAKPKPVLKERKFSKKNSREEKNSMSDPVMIMLDMNEDADSEGNVRDISPLRKHSGGVGGGGVNAGSSYMMNGGNKGDDRRGSPSKYIDSSQWNSYGSDDMKSPDEPVIPKFNIDPDVPLEPMIPLNDASDSDGGKVTGLIIGDEILNQGESSPSDMARKKEKILMQSMKRKQQAEENKRKREEAARRKKEEEAAKAEELERKKEEGQRRREAILEQHKLKKEQEKAESEGRAFPSPVSAKPVPKIRPGGMSSTGPKRPRPKTIHIDKNDVNLGAAHRIRGSTSNLRGSSSNLSNVGASTGDLRRSESRGSLADHHDRPSSRSSLSLASMGQSRTGASRPSGSLYNGRVPSSRGVNSAHRGSNAYLNEDVQDSPPSRYSRADRSIRSMSQPRGKRDSSVSSAYGAMDRGMRNDSFRSSRDSLVSRRTYTARRGSNASLYDEEDDYYYGGSLRDVSYGGGHTGRKSSSTSYLGPGSLPASRHHRRGLGHHDYDDGASDVSSTASGWSAYGYRSGGGSRLGLYREPAGKSNRPIVMNAIEHVVFPGVVNRDTRMRLLEEIDALDCPHFLLLFRDSKCQFRGLYAYYPDTEEVFKIYGTGPKQVTGNMFEKFFKYNSGGKKFTQIHTKSLSVTIDAFTIHNSLWLGKKTKLPDRRDMALVV